MQSNTDEKVPSSSFLLFENYHIFSLRTVRKHFHQNQPFAIRKSHYKCSNYLIARKIIILKNTCFALFVWQHQKGLFYIIYKVYCIYATLPLKTFLCSAGFGISWDFFPSLPSLPSILLKFAKANAKAKAKAKAKMALLRLFNPLIKLFQAGTHFLQ